jgi:hypothetical protein
LKKSNLRDSLDQTLEKLTFWLVRSYASCLDDLSTKRLLTASESSLDSLFH